MKKIRRRMILTLLLGIVGNLWIGYVLSLVLYIQAYGAQGLDHFKSYISQPGHALAVLILGDSSGVEQKIHDLFAGGWQLVYWGVVGLLLLWQYFRKPRYKKEEAADYGSHGTSRWATSSEIEKWMMGDKKGIVLGRHKGREVIHSIKSRLNHFAVVFGGAGSGKSTGLVIPNVLHIAEHMGESLVITDPKGEIFNVTAPTLRSKGYDIKVFNLLDLKKSHRYNPMDFVRTSEDASSLAEVIIRNTGDQTRKGNDDFWERAESSLLAAAILYAKERLPREQQNLRSVLEIGLSCGDDPKRMDKLFQELPDTSEAKAAYRIFAQSEDRLRSSILTGFGVRLKLWSYHEVVQLTAATDIDLDEFGEPGKKVALYIMSRSYDPTYDALPAILIDQLFQHLYQKAERMPGNRLASPVRLVLDELANIAPIAGLKRKIATMRGYGISAFLIFQSKSQFEDRYGREAASEIIDSCDTRMLLGSNDFATQEYFSKLLGSTTIRIDSISENESEKGGSYGRSKNYTERKLMTPDEVGRLPDDQLIVFQRGRYPMLLQKNFCFEWKNWAQIPKTHWAEEIPDRQDRYVSYFRPRKVTMDEETLETILGGTMVDE